VKEKFSTSSETLSKIKEQTSEIIGNIKEYDYQDSATKVSRRFLRLRNKTLSYYRRPFKDISHLSLMMVIILTIIGGLSATIGTKEEIRVNPFVSKASNSKEIYLSSTEKSILEADSVAAVASIYDRQDNGVLTQDAAATTEELYKKADVVSGGGRYLASMPILETSSSGAGSSVKKYIVQNGDTLSALAVKFGITTDTIRYANGLTDVDSIKPGQELVILPTTGVLHEVSSGQTLDAIANRYGINKSMIEDYNNLYGEEIKVGMKIMIPNAEIPEAPKPEAPTTRIAGSTRSQVSYIPSSSGPNHFPYGWCTWWVASKRNVPWSGNAWQWYGNAQAYGRSVGQTPVPGSIMVTWESGYGHVAYVESVGGGSFTVSEMNYAGWGRVSTRTISTSSVPLIGFIY
jgi:surface antigen